MNAPVRTDVAKVPVLAGGHVAALVPQSLEEAFRVSQAIAASGLAPKGLDRPEQIMVAIMAGAELGLAPFQSLQSFAVVNGRPTLWGDGLMAVARAGGVRVKEWLDGAGDDMVAHCEVTRESGEVIERTFTVTQAKKAGLWGKAGPWQSYPQRMLAMRARAYALRDGCADMLRGFQVREEVEDYEPIRDVTPRTTGMRARLEARTAVGGFDADHVSAELDAVLDGDRIPDHDPQTGEIIDAVIDPPADDGLPVRDDTPADDFPGDREPATTREAPGEATQSGAGGGLTLAQRVAAFDERLGKASTTTKLQSVWAAAANLRTDLDRADPEEAEALTGRFNARYAAVEDAERANG